MNVSGLQKKFLVFIVLAVTIFLTLILFKFIEPTLRQYVENMFSSTGKRWAKPPSICLIIDSDCQNSVMDDFGRRVRPFFERADFFDGSEFESV